MGLAGASVKGVQHTALQACAACLETSPMSARWAPSGGGPRPPPLRLGADRGQGPQWGARWPRRDAPSRGEGRWDPAAPAPPG